MVIKKIKTRKKYVRKNKLSSEKIRELEIQVDSQHTVLNDLQDSIQRTEKQADDLRDLTNAQYTEIAILRENNLNLVEVINILGRKDRMEKQEKLFSAYNDKVHQYLAVDTRKKNLDNYFEANS